MLNKLILLTTLGWSLILGRVAVVQADIIMPGQREREAELIRTVRCGDGSKPLTCGYAYDDSGEPGGCIALGYQDNPGYEFMFHVGGGSFGTRYYCKVDTATATGWWLQRVLPFYLVFFGLNYAVEWLIGWTVRVGRKPRFVLALLLANLVTHPILYYWTLKTAPAIWEVLLAELLVMVVETAVFYIFYDRLYALAKKKKSRQSEAFKRALFDSCLMMSLALNIGSFLVGLIPGVQEFLMLLERMLTR